VNGQKDLMFGSSKCCKSRQSLTPSLPQSILKIVGWESLRISSS
jgi:hypothetical protein